MLWSLAVLPADAPQAHITMATIPISYAGGTALTPLNMAGYKPKIHWILLRLHASWDGGILEMFTYPLGTYFVLVVSLNRVTNEET